MSETPTPADGSLLDVAVWIDRAMLGNESAFVRHVISALKSEGHRVSFIAPSHLDLSSLPTLGSRVCTYRWNRWEKVALVQRWRLASVIDEFRQRPADVLLVWGAGEAGPVGLFQQATAMPTIVWCWDGSELFTPLISLPHVRHVIASSEAIRDRAPAGFKVPVTVIHPGVYADEAVACYDVDGQLPCLVSLDPLSDMAAYEALIRACRKLTDDGLEFLLFAYDQGRQDHPIWRLAGQLRLLDRVSFVPFQQEAEPLLLHGDLYLHVLPNNRVLYRTLEAMGKGLAVVTCANHGADYLQDGQTCRLVQDTTAHGWHAALSDLIRDRAQGAALARRGQQHVRERHAMTTTLVQFLAVCRQTAGTPLKLAGA